MSERPGVGDPCAKCGEPIAGADLLGICDPDIYDGVVIWRHKCGHAWPRFRPGDPRHAAAERLLGLTLATTEDTP